VLRKTKSDAVRPIAVVQVPEEGLRVLYDGKNIKVLIKDHQYRGKTCGICGNNDKEEEDEFEGPAMCIHEDAEDFVAAYSMAGEHCEAVPRPKGYVRCPVQNNRRPKDQRNAIVHKVRVQTIRDNAGQTGKQVVQTVVVPRTHPRDLNAGERTNQKERENRRENPCQKLRTEYIVEGEMVCFTTKPVNACNAECRATRTEEKTVEFHCLPKASPFTKQLQQEADRAILRQLANKRVDFRRALNLPVLCGAAA